MLQGKVQYSIPMFLFLFSRYGIQSPVYLKDKNGLVISTDHNDTLHWTEGIDND